MAETTKKAPAKPRKSATLKAITLDAVAPKKAAPRKKSAASAAPQINASHEEIAALAHRYWLERGRQHGQHEQDWFRAESELLGRAS